jgi:hypothetical protein
MVGPFLPPQGYPGGGGQPVKVVTGSAKAESTQGNFTYSSGVGPLYLLPIPTPSGASTIILVVATNSEDTFASPLGYMYPASGSPSGLLYDSETASVVEAGGDLSLTISNITIGVAYGGLNFDYAVFYQ